MIQSCWVVSNALWEVCCWGLSRFGLVPSLWRWQWILPLWLLIWLAVWHGCVEGAERPTLAWPSCGSSCSPPAPTCAGSGLSTRPSSELLPHPEHTPCLYPLLCWIAAFPTFCVLSLQDRQLLQLHGFLLRLHGAGGDQYYPDCWHSWLGSVVRTFIWCVKFQFLKRPQHTVYILLSLFLKIFAHLCPQQKVTSSLLYNTFTWEQGSSMWANMALLQTILQQLSYSLY